MTDTLRNGIMTIPIGNLTDMKKILVTTASTTTGVKKSPRIGFFKDQKGVNVVEFLLILAILVVLALLIVPNLNFFLGVDKKINAANIEAVNVRAAAFAYKDYEGKGKYPSDSDALWQEPPKPGTTSVSRELIIPLTSAPAGYWMRPWTLQDISPLTPGQASGGTILQGVG